MKDTDAQYFITSLEDMYLAAAAKDYMYGHDESQALTRLRELKEMVQRQQMLIEKLWPQT